LSQSSCQNNLEKLLRRNSILKYGTVGKRSHKDGYLRHCDSIGINFASWYCGEQILIHKFLGPLPCATKIDTMVETAYYNARENLHEEFEEVS
jgi:hypothetical protein